MTKQKLRIRTSHNKIVNQNNLHTSIQFSLDGFSFCIYDQEELQNVTSYDFLESCSTPEELLSRVKEVFEKDVNLHYPFQDITVVHRNNLNTFVPNDFFSEEHIKNYFKYNIKTFATDYFTFDDIEVLNAKNAFIPFVNINNYLLDHFGNFNFYHHQTILVKKLQKLVTDDTQVFVYFQNSLIDIVVFQSKEMTFINSFEIESEKDFIYYLLFVLEQLQLNTEEVLVTLLGTITKESLFYKIAYTYVRNIKILEGDNAFVQKEEEFTPTELFILT